MDPRAVLLDHSAPVPVDRPFHRTEAAAEGVSDRQLAAWCRAGLLSHPLRGVYHAAQLPAGLDLRLACLRLVVPEDAVVTDRTAGWLHGASMVLAPNDHLVVPRVSMFRPSGYRLRNALAASGERSFLADEVVELGGVRVTSPLRTTCDLGRLRHREPAFCAMEAMARTGAVDLAELVDVAAEQPVPGVPLGDAASATWRRGSRARPQSPPRGDHPAALGRLPGPAATAAAGPGAGSRGRFVLRRRRCRGAALRRGVRRRRVARPGASAARRRSTRLDDERAPLVHRRLRAVRPLRPHARTSSGGCTRACGRSAWPWASAPGVGLTA